MKAAQPDARSAGKGVTLEQCLYGRPDGPGARGFLARSPGFADEWQGPVARLCSGFGERPPGVACPAAVFALPLGPHHVAVVQVADVGSEPGGNDADLAFRVLVVPTRPYAEMGGDPFLLDDHYPPDWSARGELPSLSWTAPPPRRTVADLRLVLDTPDGPTLLGGAQALLDGGRLLFRRDGPDGGVVRRLWSLLPTESRAGLWPASYVFGDPHRFHVAVVPPATAWTPLTQLAGPGDWISETEAGGYPEGNYELALQTAVESGNQADLDGLFARRGRPQVLRLALVLLIGFLLAALLIGPRPETPGPDLPPASAFSVLGDAERARFADRLGELADQLESAKPASAAPADLLAALEALDFAVVQRAHGRPAGEPGPPDPDEPPQRRLRVLAWKLGVEGYNDRALDPVALLDRLQDRLAEKGLGPKGADRD